MDIKEVLEMGKELTVNEDSNVIPDDLMDSICKFLTQSKNSVDLAQYMHLDDTRSSILIEMNNGQQIKGIFTIVEDEEE